MIHLYTQLNWFLIFHHVVYRTTLYSPNVLADVRSEEGGNVAFIHCNNKEILIISDKDNTFLCCTV